MRFRPLLLLILTLLCVLKMGVLGALFSSTNTIRYGPRSRKSILLCLQYREEINQLVFQPRAKPFPSIKFGPSVPSSYEGLEETILSPTFSTSPFYLCLRLLL